MSNTKPRFTNWLYRAELSRTPAGSPIVKIVPTNPKGPSGHHRQVAAFIYELAAEMETRSQEVDARWVICPDVMNARITVELMDDEEKAADEFLAQLLAERNLA